MAVGTSRKLTKCRITILALFVVMAMVGGAIIASPAAAESDSTEHVLSGTVVDESDDPIEDADVFIQDDDTDELVAEVPTDADGEYEIELEEGDYVMAAEADGFLSPSPVTVTLNEDRTQNLELETAATIEGTVKDEDDTEIEDVSVSAEQDGSSYSTSTDEEGMYSIDVPEGDYTVTVSDYRFEGGSVDVFLEKGETKEEDLEATKLSTGTLEGEVTDRDGESLEEAFVDIQQDGEQVDFVRTDADGQYDIELADGEYTVFAAKDGFQFEQRTVTIDGDATTIEEFELEELVTLDGEVTDTDDNALDGVDISLVEDGETVEETETDTDGEYEVEVPTGEYTVEISDSVHEDLDEVVTLDESETKNFELEPLATGTLEGEVTDEDGEPLEGATIDVQHDQESVDFTQTDADGQYDIELEEGEYTTTVFKDGFEVEERTVNIEEDATSIENVELEESLTLEGEVTDEEGEPIEDARVSITQDGDFVDSVQTDEEANYEVELEEGEYNVRADADGFLSDFTTVNLDEDRTQDFELEIAGVVEGTVTDEDGDAVEGVRVTAGQDGFTGTRTDENGDYSIDVPEGENTVSITDSEFEDVSKKFSVEKGETVTQDLEATPLSIGTLEGAVTDKDNEDDPIGNVEVGIFQDGDFIESVETDDDGTYEVELGEGEYSLSIDEDGFASKERDTSIEEETTTTEDFELEPLETGVLEGEVTDEEGEPIEAARVSIFQDAESVGSVQTDEEGNYAVEVEEGDYDVSISADGFAGEEHRVSISEDDTTTVDAELEIAAEIAGKVTDADDNAVEGIFVGIKQDGVVVSITATDEDGHYSQDIAEGEYTVSITDATHDGDSEEVSLVSGETTTQDLEATPVSTGTLEGEVTDQDRNTMGGALISIYQDGVFTESVDSAEDGTYDVDLGEGEYTAVVDAEDGNTLIASITVEAGETTTEDIVLEETGTVKGTVLEDSNGELSDSTVKVEQDGEILYSFMTRADGYYEAPLPPGEYTLTGNANGYEEASHEVTVTENETVTQDFELELATGTVEGEAIDEDRDPIEDAQISITQDDEEVESISTDADGSYEAELPLGEYTVTIDEDEYEAQDHEVTVTEDETVTQDFELELATGTVEGEVLDEDEDVIEAVEVSITQDDEEVESVSTDEDGSYEAELVLGQYTVSVDEDGYEAQDHEVTITEDETVTQEFELELATGSLEGEVIGEDGDPIEDAQISILQDDEEVESVSTDDDGFYETELVLGEYTVSVDEDEYEAQDSEVTLVEGEISIQDFTLVAEEDDETDAGGGGAPSLGPAEFEVSIREAPDSVAAGETVSVEVAVENVGGTTGEQTITLEHDGDQIADDTLELSRDQQRFITLTGEVDEGADGEQTFILSSDDDAVETSLAVEAETEEETDESDETEEADEDDADEADTEETEDDSEEASDDSAEAEETDDEPAEDEIVEDDDQPGFGVTVAVIALLGLLVGTRLSRNE
ncbi:carboxypeptidase regulatory-like domain-containing protein [Natranaeroarchaeum sulfidigenes]|uniref:Transglutaminase-like cysteine protease n=1 Tax=Natranaeroarchaeum sulfidigenes TaxID=2784880 RepID=A0A897MRX8_9EURY|nr:carboxypeptidase regulatory-like domain-containing protein [Natranaeroarchaeum sulfidigenes]QSG02788.1 Transglutaminase-like cysteine protease [Natranaeroarchaeum sulfidigenes]